MNFKRIIIGTVWGMFFASLISYICASRSPNFAYQFDSSVSKSIRAFQSGISSIFEISLFEILLLISPILIILLVARIFTAKSIRNVKKRFVFSISLISLVASIYTLTLGIGTFTKDRAENFFPKDALFTNQKLFDAAYYISEQMSRFPDSFDKTISNDVIRINLEASYASVLGKNISLNNPKKIILSGLFSHTGALGIYSFITGEVNLNTDIPKYTVPFTLAHEYAHYIGAGSECDADFLAFLSCIESKNPQIKYSGYLCAFEYLMSDIKKINLEMYTNIYKQLPQHVKSDLESYSKFSQIYHNGAVFDFFRKTNKKHLALSDSHGTSAYFDVTEYIVFYIDNLV